MIKKEAICSNSASKVKIRLNWPELLVGKSSEKQYLSILRHLASGVLMFLSKRKDGSFLQAALLLRVIAKRWELP